MKPGYRTTEAWGTLGYAGLVVEAMLRPDLSWQHVAALAVLAVPLTFYIRARAALKEGA